MSYNDNGMRALIHGNNLLCINSKKYCVYVTDLRIFSKMIDVKFR